MRELEEKLGYTFQNRGYLENAVTHSSYANERHLPHTACNERLEFLGDAILDVVVAERLFRNEPDMPEGKMTRTRAELVCEASLAESSENLGVGKYLRLGNGEEQSGGRSRRSILADAFEAILAAVYLDGGIEPARRMVQSFILTKLRAGTDKLADYKTELQEVLQKEGSCQIAYSLREESGPDHDKTFTVAVLINGKEAGTGTGRSKKEAEQVAARKALETL